MVVLTFAFLVFRLGFRLPLTEIARLFAAWPNAWGLVGAIVVGAIVYAVGVRAFAPLQSSDFRLLFRLAGSVPDPFRSTAEAGVRFLGGKG